MKSILKSNAFWKLYGSLKDCRILKGFSWMFLVNVIAFAVLKIFQNLVSKQRPLFANNCCSKQNYEKRPKWPNFYFYSTFRNNIQFCENTSSAWDKNTFLLKSRLHKNAEMFHVNKDCRLAICVAFAAFKIEICRTLFKRYLHENETLHTSPFYTMIYFNITFHMIWDKWSRFHSGQ